jgi:hypothetical protein
VIAIGAQIHLERWVPEIGTVDEHARIAGCRVDWNALGRGAGGARGNRGQRGCKREADRPAAEVPCHARSLQTRGRTCR